MSRIGKLAVEIPKGVDCQMLDSSLTVKGKKGELTLALHSDILLSKEDNFLKLSPVSNTKRAKAMWGTYRSLIENLVIGVSAGFSTRIEIKGVGYRAQVSNDILSLNLGFSHEIKFAIPSGVSIVCEKPTILVVSGADKQLVGQVCGELMQLRKVEPYKGKGVFVEGSYIRRKEGKKK